MEFEIHEDVAFFFTVYFTSLMIYVTVFSGLDFKTNDFYRMKWESLRFSDKVKLLINNVTHNILFFFLILHLFLLYMLLKAE